MARLWNLAETAHICFDKGKNATSSLLITLLINKQLQIASIYDAYDTLGVVPGVSTRRILLLQTDDVMQDLTTMLHVIGLVWQKHVKYFFFFFIA